MKDRLVTLLGALLALATIYALFFQRGGEPPVTKPLSTEAGRNGYLALKSWLEREHVKVVSAVAGAEPEKAAAVDKECAWGRLGDGRGHFVRCLTQEDVAHLRDAAVAPPRATEPLEGSSPVRAFFARPLTREARQQPALEAMKIYMLSGANELWDAQIAAKLGADQYLEKFPEPAVLRELLSPSSPVPVR